MTYQINENPAGCAVPIIELSRDQKGDVKQVSIYIDHSFIFLKDNSISLDMLNQMLDYYPKKLSEFTDEQILIVSETYRINPADLTEARNIEKEYRESIE